jgi:hypothetical protein
MKNYKFNKHTGTTSPVSDDIMVVYRTTSRNTPESHIHHPICAGDINWGEEELYMGEILEWALDFPKHTTEETQFAFHGSK